jgi:hypothetical protein
VTLVGSMLRIRVDGRDRDRVILEASSPKTARAARVLLMLADDVD